MEAMEVTTVSRTRNNTQGSTLMKNTNRKPMKTSARHRSFIREGERTRIVSRTLDDQEGNDLDQEVERRAKGRVVPLDEIYTR